MDFSLSEHDRPGAVAGSTSARVKRDTGDWRGLPRFLAVVGIIAAVVGVLGALVVGYLEPTPTVDVAVFFAGASGALLLYAVGAVIAALRGILAAVRSR